MIAIEQLRYVRLRTGDLAAATHFSQRILGLELVEQDDVQAAFRSDFRDHTLVFTRDTAGHTVGFEVRNTETLEKAGEALAHNGYKVTAGNPGEAARRNVKTFLSFNHASGVTIDLVVRPLHSGWRYFPSRDAGVTGLEAVALRSTSVEKGEAFGRGCFRERSVTGLARQPTYASTARITGSPCIHPHRVVACWPSSSAFRASISSCRAATSCKSSKFASCTDPDVALRQVKCS